MGCLKLNIAEENRDVLKVVHRRDFKVENKCGSYYPFGMEWDTPSHDNYGNPLKKTGLKTKYTYNGKEFIDDLDIGLNDYGARYYDAAIARFTTVDPLADYYPDQSPYNYVLNNPLIHTDPTGMSVDNEYVKDKTTGEVTKISDVGGDEVDIVYEGTDNEDGSVKVDAESTKVMDVEEKYVEDYTNQSQDEKPIQGVRNLDGNYTSYDE